MKKKTAILSMFAALAAFAAEENVIFEDKFENSSQWFKNTACEKYDGGGSFSFVDGGRSGKGLKVVTNANQIFMFNTKKPIAVKSGTTVKIAFFAKGKGTVSIHPMGVTADGKTVYLPGAQEKISASEWEEIPFIVVLKDAKGTAFEKVNLRLNFKQNSDLAIDDFRMTVK